jgi:hypothetical protein
MAAANSRSGFVRGCRSREAGGLMRCGRSVAKVVLRPKISVGVDGMGVVIFDRARQPSYEGRDWLIDGSFKLDNCLQTPNRLLRIWTQLSDQGQGNGSDTKVLKYEGAPGSSCAKPRVWGVVVGISKYEAGNKSLRYAHQDVKRFFDFWKGQGFYDVGRLTLLTAPLEGPVTREIIDAGVTQLGPPLTADSSSVRGLLASEFGKIREEGIKPTDILLIYFASRVLRSQQRY